MATERTYPSDVADEEWAFVAPYLALDQRPGTGEPERGIQRTLPHAGAYA